MSEPKLIQNKRKLSMGRLVAYALIAAAVTLLTMFANGRFDREAAASSAASPVSASASVQAVE